VSAAFGTALNMPKEYGTHWEGFGKRYGMRLTGISTSNAIEAGLGALWEENPRYVRLGRGSVLARIASSLKMTVAAECSTNKNELMPAYARHVAIVGNNFLSNTWRARSEANARHAGFRLGLGFAGRAASNAFEEFWGNGVLNLITSLQAVSAGQSWLSSRNLFIAASSRLRRRRQATQNHDA
jgi:hypothetical protein